MKSQAEIYQALLDGETLYSESFDNIIKLDGNGSQIDKHGESANYGFVRPQDWEIYKKPEWYETAEPGKVLCWFWGDDKECKFADVFIQRNTEGYEYRSSQLGDWKNCQPLTKEEIQEFMYYVPDEV